MVCDLRVIVAWFAACSLLCGCDSGKRAEPARFPVSGSVTIDGKPLAQGVVYFKTVATGAIDSADVIDGKFQGKAEQGERRVEVCSYEKVPAKADDPMSQDIQKNTIPARYNTDSQLTAKVTPNGPNEFEFKVESH
jgi:hypothetical protein